MARDGPPFVQDASQSRSGWTQEIKKAAIKVGMITMQQDGLLKAAAGLTDLAEVWRTTEE